MKGYILMLFFAYFIGQSFGRCTSTIAVTECDSISFFSRSKPIKLDSYKNILQFKHSNSLVGNSMSEEIPAGAFSLVPQVTTLYLSFNAITRVEPGAFEGLLQLTRLVLNHNVLATIKNGVFRDCYNLIFLDLGANKIKLIERNAFQELINLDEMILSFNQLEEIPQSVSALVKIKKLDLSSNRIRSVDGGALNLHRLEVLNLESNKIAQVSNDAFVGLRRLNEINLKDNDLSNLNATNLVNNLTELKTIKLAVNDFACATLRNVIGVFQSRRIRVAQGVSKSNVTVNGIACKLQ